MLLAVSCVVAFILGAVACSMLDRYALWFFVQQSERRLRGEDLLPDPAPIRLWRWLYDLHWKERCARKRE